MFDHLTHIDPWFLVQIAELVTIEKQIARSAGKNSLDKKVFEWKRKGFLDRRLADCWG